MAPQIVMIVAIAIALGINVAQHGKTKTGKYNIWDTVISRGLTVAILWWGGFWEVLYK